MDARFREFFSKAFLGSLFFTGLTFSPLLKAQDEAGSPQPEGGVEEVVVTGYRGSLEAALNNKRDATNNVESIVAEDIGKMPDLNLAESLQRVPGVAINREGGEGRNITVRGLGPDFTRTTLNGMEVPASAGGIDSSGGVNRSRSLDFNIFASELFNRIDIHKSQRASIEEGGLASTVELYTPRPFNNPGFHVSAAVQSAAENAAEESDPRITALYSQTFLNDTLGILLSYASSERTVRQEGAGAVRWIIPQDNNAAGWANTAATVIHGTPDPEANNVTDGNAVVEPLDFMLMPRLPRTDFFGNDLEREGYTASFQFSPTDSMEFTLDAVGSELTTNRTGYNFFAQFRNLFQNITPLEVTLDPTGRKIIAGSFSGVIPRSESRSQNAVTDFSQTVLSGKFDFTDSVTMNFMAGEATSEHIETQLRFNMDALNGAGAPSLGADLTPVANEAFVGHLGASEASNGVDPTLFRFDFSSNSNVPELFYGIDITDPDNFEITSADLRRDTVDRENNTVKIDFEFRGDSATAKTGIISNNREVTAIRLAPIDVNGADIPNNLLNNQLVTSFDDFTEPFPYSGNFAEAIEGPAGFFDEWLVNDFAAAGGAYGLTDNFAVRAVDATATFRVEEKSLGGYAEVEFETDFFGSPLRFNTGFRVVQTESISEGNGLVGTEVIPVTESKTDTEVLPATNVVWEIQDDLLLRLGMARNITRPALASLAPSITAITPTTGTIAQGNPNLDPIRADSSDLGVEWYFDEESLLGFTLFHKSIDSFIAQGTVFDFLSPEVQALVAAARPETADGTVGNTQIDQRWNINTPVNGEGATLNGYELTYQQPIWGGLGTILNYTHVKSIANYGNGVIGPLEGLSENSYNVTLYFETEIWGARVSMNNRDDYVTDATGADRNLQEATTGPTRLDASAFFNVTDEVTITLEAINLTEEDERLYTTGPEGDLNLVREFNNTGREVYLGARFNY